MTALVCLSLIIVHLRKLPRQKWVEISVTGCRKQKQWETTQASSPFFFEAQAWKVLWHLLFVSKYSNKKTSIQNMFWTFTKCSTVQLTGLQLERDQNKTFFPRKSNDPANLIGFVKTGSSLAACQSVAGVFSSSDTKHQRIFMIYDVTHVTVVQYVTLQSVFVNTSNLIILWSSITPNQLSANWLKRAWFILVKLIHGHFFLTEIVAWLWKHYSEHRMPETISLLFVAKCSLIQCKPSWGNREEAVQ